MEINSYLVEETVFQGCYSSLACLLSETFKYIPFIKVRVKLYKAYYLPQEKHERQKNLPLSVEGSEAEPHSYPATARTQSTA